MDFAFELDLLDLELAIKHGRHNQLTHGRRTARRAAFQETYRAARAEGVDRAAAREKAKSASLETATQERQARIEARTAKLTGRAAHLRKLAEQGKFTESQAKRAIAKAENLEARARGEAVPNKPGKKKPAGLTPEQEQYKRMIESSIEWEKGKINPKQTKKALLAIAGDLPAINEAREAHKQFIADAANEYQDLKASLRSNGAMSPDEKSYRLALLEKRYSMFRAIVEDPTRQFYDRQEQAYIKARALLKADGAVPNTMRYIAEARVSHLYQVTTNSTLRSLRSSVKETAEAPDMGTLINKYGDPRPAPKVKPGGKIKPVVEPIPAGNRTLKELTQTGYGAQALQAANRMQLSETETLNYVRRVAAVYESQPLLTKYRGPFEVDADFETAMAKEYSDRQIQALLAYQGSSSVVNGILRYRKDAIEGNASIDAIDTAMMNNRIPKNTRLYRGYIAPTIENLEAITKVGNVFNDDGYGSSSTDSEVATNFAGNSRNSIFMTILAPAGAQAVYMPNVNRQDSGRPGKFSPDPNDLYEAEVILPRGSTYIIREVADRPGGGHNVTAELVSIY